MIGIIGPQGRALSKASGSSFVAQIWLENDGGPVPQEEAANRPGYTRDGRIVRVNLGDWLILQMTGKTALAALDGCGGADVLISNQQDVGPRPCIIFDINRLRQTGALALDLSQTGDLLLTTAQGVAGNRPWNANADASAEPTILLQKR
jgi:competence protein ComEC